MLRIIQVPLILLIAWLGGGTWYWVCQVRGFCGDDTSTEVVSSTTSKEQAEPTKPVHFVVLDAEGKEKFTGSPALRFPSSGAEARVPKATGEQISLLADFLKENPAQQLQITGLYYRNEESSAGENLGLERAIFLANQLEELGVSSTQLTRLPKRLDEANVADSVVGGLEMNLLALLPQESPEEAAPILSPPPSQNFYFGYNQSDLILSDEERTYIAKVIQYVRSQTEAQLELTGHTDNKGPALDNMKLGMQRAETVEGFFVSFGLPENRIEVASKGEAEPVETNDTTEGRKKNRRVEIKVISSS